MVEVESRVVIPLAVEVPKETDQLPGYVRISLGKAHMLIPALPMLRTANPIKFPRKKGGLPKAKRFWLRRK